VSKTPMEIDVLVGILAELKRFNDRLDAAKPPTINVNTRSHDGFERDFSAYHLPETVYPFGRNV
jgi:hypothetical protein